jgi:hypothetical protein
MRTPLLLLVLALSSIQTASAHGGGLNAQGCHNNRKTGDYHCHRAAQPSPTRPAPASSVAQSPDGKPNAVLGSFPNCAAARAAGAAPVLRGEPGYGPHLDRDNDGIGCE